MFKLDAVSQGISDKDGQRGGAGGRLSWMDGRPVSSTVD
jgi:hypothetical protein